MKLSIAIGTITFSGPGGTRTFEGFRHEQVDGWVGQLAGRDGTFAAWQRADGAIVARRSGDEAMPWAIRCPHGWMGTRGPRGRLRRLGSAEAARAAADRDCPLTPAKRGRR